MRSALSLCRSIRTAQRLTPRAGSASVDGPAPSRWRSGERHLLGQLVVAHHQRGRPPRRSGRRRTCGRVQHHVGAQARGGLQMGEAKVLSHDHSGARAVRHVGGTAMSAMPSSGLVGVSHQSSFVSGHRGAQRGQVTEVDRRVPHTPPGPAPCPRSGTCRRRRRAGGPVVAGLDAAPAIHVGGPPSGPERDAVPAALERGQAPAARCGSGWRYASTRSRRPGPRPRRPGCRWRTGWSGGSPHRVRVRLLAGVDALVEEPAG